jgi:hypothetical protein
VDDAGAEHIGHLQDFFTNLLVRRNVRRPIAI